MLSQPEMLKDPYATLSQFQAKKPVYYDKNLDIFFCLGHREFKRVCCSKAMGRDIRQWDYSWDTPENKQNNPLSYQLFAEFQQQMINVDGQDHKRMRSVYESAFRPPAVKKLEADIVAETDILLDALVPDKVVNVIEHFAAPLPLRVLRNLFGIPKSMDAAIAGWSEAIIRIGDIMITEPQKKLAYDSLMEFKAYLRDFIEFRKRTPGDGLVDYVIEVEKANGQENEDEVLTNLLSMLIAGHETTVSLIGNGILSLLQFPDEMMRLRDSGDPALYRSACEEFMRYEPGGNMILRIALEDFPLDAVTIPKGAMCVGLISAINRDPEVFNNPHSLDVGRKPNPHMTFGGGIHFCIGAPLARLEGQIAFKRLLERFPKITLAGEHEWRLDRLNAHALASLPVYLEASC